MVIVNRKNDNVKKVKFGELQQGDTFRTLYGGAIYMMLGEEHGGRYIDLSYGKSFNPFNNHNDEVVLVHVEMFWFEQTTMDTGTVSNV